MELHGGQVEATSLGEGLGATFRVALPCISPPKDVRPVAAPAAGSIAGLRVLVVEDDREVRETLVTALETAGAVVHAAATAAEGLAAFETVRPQVLLTDLAMPTEDGYSLIAKVRALPPEKGGHVPAAALTALASDDDQTQVLAAGFQAHIRKPVAFAVLVDSVARLAGN